MCTLTLTHSQVDFALQRNRQNIGRRYIEVFRCKREEYYAAVAQEVSSGKVGGSSPRRSMPPPRPRPSADGSKDDHVVYTGILRMRGLPFSAGKEEIIDFFRDFELSEQKVHLVVNPDGRPSGEAFVEFNSADDSKEAMKNDRMTLGSRYIELFPSHMKEMEEAISRERL
jgi:heterogeneous nuclear ribonucleoprotein F/H